MTKESKNLLFFGYGLGLISVLLGIKEFMKHGMHWPSLMLLICCIVFVSTTAFNWQALRPGYICWIKVSRLIGSVATAMILTVVYFLVFTPIAIVIRLSGRDHLDRAIDPALKSYWHIRAQQNSLKERYLKQY